MAKPTAYQRLETVFGGGTRTSDLIPRNYDLSMAPVQNVLYTTKDKADYEAKKLELSQTAYLARAWRHANYNLSTAALNGLSNVKLMYRDADLMDAFPEIGAALDIYAEEACTLGESGSIINVYSDSERIKSIIEDLLVNRLQMQTVGPMIFRAMCKYGNQFMLLDINKSKGVRGWRQLPVFEVERYENGIDHNLVNPGISDNGDEEETATEFIWVGANGSNTYRNWQIAHFRLLNDSMFWPYGVSALHKARRHFRMLSMMEDMMLIYRMERSIERRVFKIYVGDIDDADVPAYMDDVANTFKRAPVVDPNTGQLDLRKMSMSVTDDYFIPVRDMSASNPIETLNGAQNMTAMDDIKFVQKKVLAGLTIPAVFINFEEKNTDAGNLAMQDIRFARKVNRYQQAFLEEVTKVIIIHLYLLGFHDDLTNFTLTMNNPSTQAEIASIDMLQKKVQLIRDATSEASVSHLPVMSMENALKRIMKWSDRDIHENLQQLRLEAALGDEIGKTGEIIKRTHLFDEIDRLYGEPDAQYSEQAAGNPEDGGMMPGGGGGGGFSGGGGFAGGSDFGSDLGDLGAEGEPAGGAIEGNEGEMPLSSANMGGATDEGPNGPATPASGNEPPQGPPLTEQKGKTILKEVSKQPSRRPELTDKNLLINETFDNMMMELDTFLENNNNE